MDTRPRRPIGLKYVAILSRGTKERHSVPTFQRGLLSLHTTDPTSSLPELLYRIIG